MIFSNLFHQTCSGTSEFRIVWSDGSVHHIKAVTFIEKDTNDAPVRIIGVNEDITGTKQREWAIRESEAKYRSFFENSMDGLLLTETDGGILAANPAACEIFQMTETEICSAGRMGLIDLNDPRVAQLLQLRQRTGKAKGEITYKRKDGSTFPGDLTSAAFTDNNGRLLTSMIIRDVTDRRQAEQVLLSTSSALQTALSDLNRIMDSSLDIICTLDKHDKILTLSSAVKDIWGYAPHELAGKDLIHFVYNEDVNQTQQIGEKIRKGMPVTMFENRIVRKDGRLVPMLWSARCGEDGFMYCIARDATEKKKMEQAFNFERQRFYDLFLTAPLAIAVLEGPNHIFQLANPNYLKLIGKTNIIGKPVEMVLPEIVEQGFIKVLNDVFHTGIPFHATEMMVQFNQTGGNVLANTYLNFNFLPNKNADGLVEGIFIFAHEVTEQVISRKKISYHTANQQAILNTTDTGYVLVDKNLHIIAFNRNANERILQSFNKNLLEGKNYLGYFTEEHSRFKFEKIQKVLAGDSIEIEVQLPTMTGTKKWYSIIMNPILVNNEVDGICFATKDITSIKE